MELLLKHLKTKPNLHDKECWTPLLISTNEGHDVVVELLLGHVDADPNYANNEGWTPLLIAANDGHEVMVM